MIYRVQGSWDGLEWWNNERVIRTCGASGYDFENLEVAQAAASMYTKTRPFKYRRIIDQQDQVVWSYNPGN